MKINKYLYFIANATQSSRYLYFIDHIHVSKHANSVTDDNIFEGNILHIPHGKEQKFKNFLSISSAQNFPNNLPFSHGHY